MLGLSLQLLRPKHRETRSWSSPEPLRDQEDEAVQALVLFPQAS